MPDQNMTVRDQYLEQMVESAGREALLMLLVEAAVNFIRRALFAFERERLDEVNTCLIKAQNIYLELVITLDLDAGEFAGNLAMVYQFLYNLLIEANMEKDPEKMKTGLRLAEDIRDLWKETIEKAKGADSEKAVKVAVVPESIDPKLVRRTGVYEPAIGARIAEAKPFVEESKSRLNVTG